MSPEQIGLAMNAVGPPVLQGYMYLTDAYICFFAHLPAKEVSARRYRPRSVYAYLPIVGSSSEVGLSDEEDSAHEEVDTALVCAQERCAILVPVCLGENGHLRGSVDL